MQHTVLLLRRLLHLPTPVMMTTLQTCWNPSNQPDCKVVGRTFRMIGTCTVRCSLDYFSVVPIILQIICSRLLRLWQPWRKAGCEEEKFWGRRLELPWFYSKSCLELQNWLHIHIFNLEHLVLRQLTRPSDLLVGGGRQIPFCLSFGGWCRKELPWSPERHSWELCHSQHQACLSNLSSFCFQLWENYSDWPENKSQSRSLLKSEQWLLQCTAVRKFTGNIFRSPTRVVQCTSLVDDQYKGATWIHWQHEEWRFGRFGRYRTVRLPCWSHIDNPVYVRNQSGAWKNSHLPTYFCLFFPHLLTQLKSETPPLLYLYTFEKNGALILFVGVVRQI